MRITYNELTKKNTQENAMHNLQVGHASPSKLTESVLHRFEKQMKTTEKEHRHKEKHGDMSTVS